MKIDKTSEFRCAGCGNCCRESGYVYISIKEVRAAAKFLKTTVGRFSREYTRKSGRWNVLKRTFKGGCPFLNKNRCRIYPVRPRQCKTFPYWPEHFKEKKYLKDTLRFCPSMRGIIGKKPRI